MEWLLFGKRLKELREERRLWEARARESDAAAKEEAHKAAQLIEIIQLYENEIIGIDHAGYIMRIGPNLHKLRKGKVISDLIDGKLLQGDKELLQLEDGT